MTKIDEKLLRRFAVKLADTLRGDWVILGGTVLPLLGISYRATVDIDVAGPRTSSQEDTLKLMEIAEGLGLSVESINQAGAYFLHRIDKYEQNLVLYHAGRKGALYRPNATLFILLKMERLSETDLTDCLVIIDKLSDTEPIDKKLIKKTAVRLVKKNKIESYRSRIKKVLQAVEG